MEEIAARLRPFKMDWKRVDGWIFLGRFYWRRVRLIFDRKGDEQEKKLARTQEKKSYHINARNTRAEGTPAAAAAPPVAATIKTTKATRKAVLPDDGNHNP